MTDLSFYDAAYPPHPEPHADGFCFYIGGDAYHVWTDEEIGSQTARYRLPVFVRSNPPGPGAETDAAAAVARLKHLGAPHGTLVAWDMETAKDPAYIRDVYTALKAAGYSLIVYGTESDVHGNDNPDGLYWGADWSGGAHLHNGDAITQWVSFSGYDESLAKPGLPFWDTRPHPAPSPATEDIVTRLPALRQGDKDTQGEFWSVHRLQALLGCWGKIAGATTADGLAEDGVFGPATVAALKACQEHYRIAADGVCGAQSWAVLLTGAP